MVYHIGTGSGKLALPAGLAAGDSVGIKTGTYSGFSVTGFSGITFFPEGGPVTFISGIAIGNTRDMVFDGTVLPGVTYGFIFTGTDYAIFITNQGNNVNLTVKGWDFGGGATMVFDAVTKINIPNWDSPLLTYNGTPESCVFYNLVCDTFHCGPKTSVFQGAWDQNTTYHMVVIGLKLWNAVIENSVAAGDGMGNKVHGLSVYGMDIANWHISGPNSTGGGDYGIIFTQGSGTVKNIYRNGGYGYIWRHQPMILGGNIPFNQVSGIYNCIDINSTRYGTIDIEMSPVNLASNAPISIKGADFECINNVSGDKTDAGYYVTSMVIVGALVDDLGKQHTITIENNIAYNAAPNSGTNNSSLLKDNSGKLATIILKANIDLLPGVKLPAGYFVDTINFVPTPKGPLVGTGVPTSNLYDMNGNLRSNPPDIGAVNAVAVDPPIPPIPTPLSIVSSFSDYLKKTVTVTYNDGSTKTIS